ncbi:MAG: molybdopterin synthase catalytic subunit MoaE [Pseudomonadota bacterium]
MIPRILVQADDFDVNAELAILRAASSRIGGMVTFLGVVRDVNEAAAVSTLYLEHYPGMTEKQIATIVGEACERWALLGATVIHRIGELAPTDQIVFVGVAAEHRGEAFDACEYIIDFLKTRATFWKKEQTPAGDRWLETRASDETATQRWQHRQD